MRNYLILIMCILFISCNQNDKSSRNDSIEVLLKEDDLQIEKENDETTDVSITMIEDNLKIQLTNYQNALLNGKGEDALKYCLPEMFTYMEREFPEYNRKEIEEFLIITTSRDVKAEMDKNNLKCEFEINNVKEIISWDLHLIYEVVAFITIIDGTEERSNGDKIYAFSDDGGDNWCFLQHNNETIRPILLMKYPIEKVNKILK